MKKCPACAEDIQDAAVKCKHCGTEFGKIKPPAKKSGGVSTCSGCLAVIVAILFFSWLGSHHTPSTSPSDDIGGPRANELLRDQNEKPAVEQSSSTAEAVEMMKQFGAYSDSLGQHVGDFRKVLLALSDGSLDAPTAYNELETIHSEVAELRSKLAGFAVPERYSEPRLHLEWATDNVEHAIEKTKDFLDDQKTSSLAAIQKNLDEGTQEANQVTLLVVRQAGLDGWEPPSPAPSPHRTSGSSGQARDLQQQLRDAALKRYPQNEATAYNIVPYETQRFAITKQDGQWPTFAVWELKADHWSWIFEYPQKFGAPGFDDGVNAMYNQNQFSVNMRHKLEGGMRSQLHASAPAAGDPRQIQFAPGTSQGIVSGRLVRDQQDTYTLDARAGQEMDVRIASPEANAVFHIYSPNAGGKALPGAGVEANAMAWHGGLPATGTYRIVVNGTGRNAVYTLTVSIN